jgi:hypothetical protein
MDILTNREINQILNQSKLIDKYDEVIDRDSAYEILSGKMEEAEARREEMERQQELGRKYGGSRSRGREKSTFEKVMSNTTTRQIGRTVARELTRGLLGVLGVRATTTRRKRSTRSWF